MDGRLSVLARSAGLHLLAADAADQQANDGRKGANGIFTSMLLLAIDRPETDKDGDGYVSPAEIGVANAMESMVRWLPSARGVEGLRKRIQTHQLFHFSRDFLSLPTRRLTSR